MGGSRGDSLEPDPELLLRRARDGSSGALGQLLEHYREYLALLARVQIDKRLQGKIDPSDLVQETFAEASRAFHGFLGKTEPELVHWLRRMMATRTGKLVRRYYGTQQRDPRVERELYNELDRSSQALGAVLAASETSPSMKLARREQSVLLARALARLPDAQREAVILRHLEGIDTIEVARRMGKSVGGVRALCARAIATLRQLMGE